VIGKVSSATGWHVPWKTGVDIAFTDGSRGSAKTRECVLDGERLAGAWSGATLDASAGAPPARLAASILTFD